MKTFLYILLMYFLHLSFMIEIKNNSIRISYQKCMGKKGYIQVKTVNQQPAGLISRWILLHFSKHRPLAFWLLFSMGLCLVQCPLLIRYTDYTVTRKPFKIWKLILIRIIFYLFLSKCFFWRISKILWLYPLRLYWHLTSFTTQMLWCWHKWLWPLSLLKVADYLN